MVPRRGSVANHTILLRLYLINLRGQTHNILVYLIDPRMKGKLRISRLDLRGFYITRIVQNLLLCEVRSTGTERLDKKPKRIDNIFARVIFHQFDQSLGNSAIGNLRSLCQRSVDTNRFYRMSGNVHSDCILACSLTHPCTHLRTPEQSS